MKPLQMLDVVALWYARGFLALLLIQDFSHPATLVFRFDRGHFAIDAMGAVYSLFALCTMLLRFDVAKLFIALCPLAFTGVFFFFAAISPRPAHPLNDALIGCWFVGSLAIMSYVGFRAFWNQGAGSNGNQGSTITTSLEKRSAQKSIEDDNSSHSSAIPFIPSNLVIP